MHPRLLAIDGSCSGGTCPAVYDNDPDLVDELAIVGNAASFGLQRRLADRIADDENVIVIKRKIVAEALRPANEPINLERLMTMLETFSYSAFRLETQQVYADTGRDDQWISLLKAGRRWGKTYQRVHIVSEPLTTAMQEELTAGYEGNVAAGEEIRIIPLSDTTGWPEALPQYDFWLFDNCMLFAMRYESDGTWAGAEYVADPRETLNACYAREVALRVSHPWHAYIANRPELQRRLAQ